MADVKLNVGADTRRLEADIKKAVSRSYSVDLKTSGSQPLGRITSQLSEFNKSLEASNARVIAFGASAGVIYGLQSAFSALISTTIEVQKSLADINVILNASSSDLAKFSDSLFDIARNTGKAFGDVASAATEFSRQGLGIEETLKRTSDALILSRLSGLDAAKSVEALTAAVNSFAAEAVTASEVVNKFANVDAAFAVSSADLAEAIARVGSSASQSGVSLNELISIVTSAQQTTARGGAVIGNSFKTIFTRLQRGKVIDLLESLGVDTMDSQGQLKSTINLLKDLAGVYDTLGTVQQAEVAEKVGGVFQINILKSALADLGKEFSIYDRALQIAASSTDQAIQRNVKLNETYAAQLNALKENAAQLAAAGGERIIGPSFERVVGGANAILGGINESDGQGIGAALGKGILDGVGQILAGPGLALIGGVIIKLFKDFTVYAGGSVKELLGLNNASKQQAQIQQSINSIIAQNPQLLQLMTQGTKGVNDAAQLLLNSLQQQTIELQKQDAITSKIASQLYKGGVRVQGGVPTATKTKADGYIPAFSKEGRDVQRGVGGARPSDVPIGPFNINGEPTIINSGEKLVPDFGGSGETAILTRDMQKSVSMAEGYVPNFAIDRPYERAKRSDLLKKKPGNEDYDAAQAELGLRGGGETFDADKILGFKLPGLLVPPGGAGKGIITKQNLLGDDNNIKFDFPVASLQIQGNQKLQQEAEKMFVVDDNFITQFVDKQVLPFTHALANTIGSPPADPKTTRNIAGVKGLKGSIEGALGAIFDAALISAVGEASAEAEGGDFDVRASGKQFEYIDKLFTGGRGSLGGTANNLGDFKKSAGPDATNSMVAKTLKEYPNKFKPKIDNTQKNKAKKTRSRATGYIPNFADALNDAVQREIDQSGLPKNQIYVSQKDALVAPQNPAGLGVFNTRDEGSASKENAAIKNRSTGYVPNFAEVDAQSLSSTIGAISIQLISLAAVLSLGKTNTEKEFDALTQIVKRSMGDTRKALADEIKVRRQGIQQFSSASKKILAEEVAIRNQGIQAWLTKAKSSIDQRAIAEQKSTAEIRKAIAEEVAARRQGTQKLISARSQALAQEISALKRINAEKIAAERANLAAARQNATIMQRAQAGLGSAIGKISKNATGIAFGLQIVASTLQNAIPQTTKGGRVGAAAVGAVGSIASSAATGALLGKGPGAVIGAVIGAFAGITDVVSQLATDMPEFSAAVEEASRKLQKLEEGGQNLLQSREAYDTALASGDESLIQKTRSKYIDELNNATPEMREAMTSAGTLAEAQLNLQAVIAEETKVRKEKLLGEALQGVKETTGTIGYGSSGSATFSYDPNRRGAPAGINDKAVSVVADLLSKEVTSSVTNLDLKSSLNAKFQDAINNASTSFDPNTGQGQKAGAEALSGIVSDIEKELGVTLPDSLKQTITGSGNFRAGLEVLKRGLDQISQTAKDTAAATGNSTSPLEEFVRKLKTDFIGAMNGAADSISALADFSKDLQSAINSLVSEQTDFERQRALSQTVGGAGAVAQQITGADSSVSIQLALKEALLGLELGRQKSIADQSTTASESISGTIGKIIDDQTKIIKETGGADIMATATDKTLPVLQKTQAKLAALDKLAGTDGISKSVSDKISSAISASGNRGIDTENANRILDEINQELIDGGVDPALISNLNKVVTNQLQAANNALAQINLNTDNQVQATKDATQRQLTAKEISGALQAFGGIREFIDNPQTTNPFLEDRKNKISARTVENVLPVRDAFENISKIVQSTNFRYNNPESVAAREKQMPDLGREYLKLISFLKERTGGLYEPKAGSKAIKDTEKGREVTIKEEMRAMEEFLKSREAKQSPEAAKEVKAALDAINKLGTKEIARIQVAQATGTLTMGDAQKVFDNSQTRTGEVVKGMVNNMDLSSALDQLLAVDGTEGALSQLTIIEARSLKELMLINTLLKTTKQSDPESNVKLDMGLPPENMTRMPVTYADRIGGNNGADVNTTKLYETVTNTEASALTLTTTIESLSSAIQANITNLESLSQNVADLNNLRSVGGGVMNTQSSKPETGLEMPTQSSTRPAGNTNVSFNLDSITVNGQDYASIESKVDAKLDAMKADIMSKFGTPQPPTLYK